MKGITNLFPTDSRSILKLTFAHMNMHLPSSNHTYSSTNSSPSISHGIKNPNTKLCFKIHAVSWYKFLISYHHFSKRWGSILLFRLPNTSSSCICDQLLEKWKSLNIINLLVGPNPTHFIPSFQKSYLKWIPQSKQKKERKWWIKKRHKCTDAFYCRMKRESRPVRAWENRDRSKKIHAKRYDRNRVEEHQLKRRKITWDDSVYQWHLCTKIIFIL